MPKPLTALDHERFCLEYIKDLNITQASARASISKRTAIDLMKREDIHSRIAELCNDRIERVIAEGDEVLREIAAVATADANELIEYRRTCCRYCHGAGFKYQRTPAEREHIFKVFKQAGRDLIEAFDEEGGASFDARKEPHADCPECHGEGVGSVFVKDTRKLSRVARKLYAGAKVTKDGIEIKTHSRDKNIELLARHLGLLNDKLEVKGKLALTVATGVPGVADDLV